MERILQLTAGGIGALCAALWGGLDGLFYALLIIIGLDYCTGVIIAILNKKLSSEIGFKGICKKVLILFLVAVANIIDTRVLNTGHVLRTAVCYFYIANEGISILENAGRLGLPLPKKLKDTLAQLRDSEEAKDYIPTDDSEK